MEVWKILVGWFSRICETLIILAENISMESQTYFANYFEATAEKNRCAPLFRSKTFVTKGGRTFFFEDLIVVSNDIPNIFIDKFIENKESYTEEIGALIRDKSRTAFAIAAIYKQTRSSGLVWNYLDEVLAMEDMCCVL